MELLGTRHYQSITANWFLFIWKLFLWWFPFDRRNNSNDNKINASILIIKNSFHSICLCTVSTQMLYDAMAPPIQLVIDFETTKKRIIVKLINVVYNINSARFCSTLKQKFWHTYTKLVENFYFPSHCDFKIRIDHVKGNRRFLPSLLRRSQR